MKKITFLGPVGATFSHQAYSLLSHLYDAPSDTDHDVELLPATRNGEVINQIIKHGGYGAIAMETRAEGRVAEPLESFIELLRDYANENQCPVSVIGAIKMKLHFSLLVRKGIAREDIERIVAHPKALGACKRGINRLNVPTVDTLSNGKAAEDVALCIGFERCAALAPASAAHKYGLRILEPAFEDAEAVTTFFLLGHQGCSRTIIEDSRVLIVFRTSHVPGALVSSLASFQEFGLNLMQIHSVHTGNGSYDFAIEIECPKDSSGRIQSALRQFKTLTPRSIVFGPFPIQDA
ncbi:MAG: prephenate dehydratase domain-containing protein [Candidatus Pacebacteria bacterium]|nr:prephenate dehydratase domain-containing protein [Candidatus Paceibacterota bacterium]